MCIALNSTCISSQPWPFFAALFDDAAAEVSVASSPSWLPISHRSGGRHYRLKNSSPPTTAATWARSHCPSPVHCALSGYTSVVVA